MRMHTIGLVLNNMKLYEEIPMIFLHNKFLKKVLIIQKQCSYHPYIISWGVAMSTTLTQYDLMILNLLKQCLNIL